ncbi:MAG: serine/threonine protein kinase/tetratricopeptide (TPR) repeat protein [Gammaproteobacteria bacterium]|jgi:serine/threonine protein kinase/tetratricopeptide (TPR) repeat protein
MTSDWQRVRKLVEDALSHPTTERAAFVESECGADEALRVRVLALLAQDDADDDYMAPPGGMIFGAADPPQQGNNQGLPRRLGPWELRRELGTGGMGSVYLAVRADGQFQRQVAIKLIRTGMDHGEMIARFHRERQVLANLDHPGIARMLDAGLSADGRPYLVMEFVEGIPIDRYCDENRLSPEERVELFRQVCDAVQHAHQNLVVHRDLKPNNILVTSSGEPKLLDFGIAKILDPEKAAGVEMTQGVMHFMTPAYASPEQIRNRTVTTASDVYSLGVVLYRLLTGHLPLDLGTGTPAEIERVVCEVDPPKPSTVVTRTREASSTSHRPTTTRITPEFVSGQRLTTPRGLVRALSGDLDSIIMMAMRKELHRRYGSVAELSQDLRRFLGHLPVVAQPDTAVYRGVKFVRRNKFMVATALVVVGSLTGGLVVARKAQVAESAQRSLAEEHAQRLSVLAEDLEREKTVAEDRAERMRILAQELEQEKGIAQRRLEDIRSFSTSLIFDVAQKIVHLEGAAPAVKALCQTGIQFLDKLHRDVGDDTELLRELAVAYSRLGQVQSWGTQARSGNNGALVSLDKGLDLAAQACEIDVEDPRNAFAYSTCLNTKGLVMEGLWRSDEAEGCFREAVEVCEAVIGPVESPLIGHVFCWWDALERLSRNLEFQLRFDEADELVDPAGIVLEKMQARWPEFPAVRSAAVSFARWQSRIELQRGDSQLGLDHAQRAVDLQEAYVRDRPHPAEWRILWKMRLDQIAAQGSTEDAQAQIEVALGAQQYFEGAIAADPANLQSRFDLMTALHRISSLHVEAGDLARAREAATAAADWARRELQANAEDSTARFLLAGALLQGTEVERRAGDLIQAQDLATEARILVESAAGRREERHSAAQMLWTCYGTLGRVFLSMAESPNGSAAARRSSITRAKAWFEKSLVAFDERSKLGPLTASERRKGDRLRAELKQAEALEMEFD